MPRRRKPKPFRAIKEIKRRARILVGSPPPGRKFQDTRGQPPKHKKQARERELD